MWPFSHLSGFFEQSLALGKKLIIGHGYLITEGKQRESLGTQIPQDLGRQNYLLLGLNSRLWSVVLGRGELRSDNCSARAWPFTGPQVAEAVITGLGSDPGLAGCTGDLGIVKPSGGCGVREAEAAGSGAAPGTREPVVA